MRVIFLSIFATFSILLSTSALAQKDKGDQKRFDKEAFDAKRNAFITAEIGLTPEEAAEFIPMTDELRKKKFEAGRESRKLSKEINQKRKNGEIPTDAEYEAAVSKSLEAEIEEARLEKEYYEKFKRILSAEKIYKYRKAEAKFLQNFYKGRDGKKD